MERRKFVMSAMAATAGLPVLNALGGNKKYQLGNRRIGYGRIL